MSKDSDEMPNAHFEQLLFDAKALYDVTRLGHKTAARRRASGLSVEDAKKNVMSSLQEVITSPLNQPKYIKRRIIPARAVKAHRALLAALENDEQHKFRELAIDFASAINPDGRVAKAQGAKKMCDMDGQAGHDESDSRSSEDVEMMEELLRGDHLSSLASSPEDSLSQLSFSDSEELFVSDPDDSDTSKTLSAQDYDAMDVDSETRVKENLEDNDKVLDGQNNRGDEMTDLLGPV